MSEENSEGGPATQESNNEEQRYVVADTESDIFNSEMMERIEQAKQSNASLFQSYWEADENDVQNWTKKEIALDPIKKFISSAENGKLDDLKSIINDLRKIVICLSFII